MNEREMLATILAELRELRAIVQPPPRAKLVGYAGLQTPEMDQKAREMEHAMLSCKTVNDVRILRGLKPTPDGDMPIVWPEGFSEAKGVDFVSAGPDIPRSYAAFMLEKKTHPWSNLLVERGSREDTLRLTFSNNTMSRSLEITKAQYDKWRDDAGYIAALNNLRRLTGTEMIELKNRIDFSRPPEWRRTTGEFTFLTLAGNTETIQLSPQGFAEFERSLCPGNRLQADPVLGGNFAT